jgi:RNA polymerase sigma-B factor
MTTAKIASAAVDHPAASEARAELAGADRRAQDAALFARYREHADPQAREALVLRFLPLARHLARHYRATGEQDDLDQVASLALLKAIDRFDPERGIAFTSFAVPTIAGELKRYFRDKGWAVRVPRSVQELKLRIDREQPRLSATLGRSPTAAELGEATGASLEEVVDALGAGSAHRPDSLDRPLGEGGTSAVELVGGELEPGYARAEAAMLVGNLMQSLSERERTILRLRFERDLTQAEIGQRLGISQMHVSRLIRQAIATLQAESAAAR